jgi:hypothetical protein
MLHTIFLFRTRSTVGGRERRPASHAAGRHITHNGMPFGGRSRQVEPRDFNCPSLNLSYVSRWAGGCSPCAGGRRSGRSLSLFPPTAVKVRVGSKALTTAIENAVDAMEKHLTSTKNTVKVGGWARVRAWGWCRMRSVTHIIHGKAVNHGDLVRAFAVCVHQCFLPSCGSDSSS